MRIWRKLWSLSPEKKCTYMESCNITWKGPCTPGSMLLVNEEEEPCLFIINTVVIGTLHLRPFLCDSQEGQVSAPELEPRFYSFRPLNYILLVWCTGSLMFDDLKSQKALWVSPWRNPRRRWNHYSLATEQDITAPLGPHSRPDGKLGKEIMCTSVSIHHDFWREQNRTTETQYLPVLTLWLPGSFVVQENEALTAFVKCAKHISQI